MKKQVLFVFVLIATLLVATGSAAAKATRTEFRGTYYNCGPTGPPAKVWETGDGRVLHMRGSPGRGYATSTHDYYNATNEDLASYDLNLVTGSGGLHGTFEKTVTTKGINGGWQGTFGGHFKNGLAYLSIVGHGTGELAGMKYFAKFVPITPLPAVHLCLPGELAGLSEVTGVILDMRGPKP